MPTRLGLYLGQVLNDHFSLGCFVMHMDTLKKRNIKLDGHWVPLEYTGYNANVPYNTTMKKLFWLKYECYFLVPFWAETDNL